MPRRRALGGASACSIIWVGVVVLGCGCGRSDDAEAAVARAEDLREIASPVLARALTAGSSSQRARAALAMGRIQDPGYAALLAVASRDAEPGVREAALFALGQLGLAEGARPPAPAVEACTVALSDPDPAIVATAVEALGKLSPDGIESSIVPLLGHPDPAVRARAAEALFRLRYVPVWRRQADAPPALDEASEVALIAALNDATAEVRRAAAHAMSRYGQPSAVDALTARLSDVDEWVRMFAARAIGRSDRPAAAAALVTATGDASEHVRAEAVAALAALGRADLLRDGLADDPSFHVRAALARALGPDSGRRDPDLLRRLEADRSPTVSAAAIESLAGLLGEAYLGRLSEHLADQRPTIRRAAVRAAGGSRRSEKAVVVAFREDADPSVRVAALEVLAGTEGGGKYVREALSSDDLALRGTAVGLLGDLGAEAGDVQTLREAYRHSAGVAWVEVRESIVDALGRSEDDEVGTVLGQIALDDPAASVRRRARTVLERAGREVAGDRAAAGDLPPSPFLDRLGRDDLVVTLETDKGTMKLLCLASEAPIHVASFVERVEQGYYDGLSWHRVVPNFVIQGGDPRGDGWGGAGYLLRDEINRVPFERGTVGMPKAGKDTGGGQLFITLVPTPHLDGNYTAFARVISGVDVVDRIEIGDRILRASVASRRAD